MSTLSGVVCASCMMQAWFAQTFKLEASGGDHLPVDLQKQLAEHVGYNARTTAVAAGKTLHCHIFQKKRGQARSLNLN